MRIVVDTNVVISRYISPRGNAAKILKLWKQRKIEIVATDKILDEYHEVFGYKRLQKYHKLTEKDIEEIIDDFREFSISVEPSREEAIIKDDPDDDKFLACALEGNVNCIVTGDRHLLDLKEYQGIPILKPKMFLSFLQTGLDFDLYQMALEDQKHLPQIRKELKRIRKTKD